MRKDPVPQGYQSPAVPLDTAKNITVGKSPAVEPSMPFTEFAEVSQPARSSESPVRGRKIGEEHAIGMLKLGAHELTKALQALPDSNITPGEEAGVFGNESMPHIQHDYTPRPTDHDRSRSR